MILEMSVHSYDTMTLKELRTTQAYKNLSTGVGKSKLKKGELLKLLSKKRVVLTKMFGNDYKEKLVQRLWNSEPFDDGFWGMMWLLHKHKGDVSALLIL